MNDDLNDIYADALRITRDNGFEAANRYLHDQLDRIGDTKRALRSGIHAILADTAVNHGDLNEGLRQYKKALELSKRASYQRYGVELQIGALYEKLGNEDVAARNYANAITTALNGHGISAGAAIARLVALRGDKLTPAERRSCERGAEKSWALFGLAGKPPLNTLEECARQLIEHASGRIDKNG